MNENYRIIDANLNRVSEALRTIEEIARFHFDDALLTEQFKSIRHEINKSYSDEYITLLDSRDSEGDIGLSVPNNSGRASVIDLLKANFKRSEQALRVLEEYSKIERPELSNIFESARYKIYTMEKNMSFKAQLYSRQKKLENKKLYLVTDRSKFEDDNTFLDAVSSAVKGGVSIVQLREKNASTKKFIELAKVLKEICSQYDALFIINDRIDVAMAVGADGVHLGQDDMDIYTARKILGDAAIIGISTHKPEDAINAINHGADYIGVGPVFTTPTKPGREAVGFEYVKWAAENVDIPFFAIGGINIDNLNQVIEAGASRIAVVRAIINAESPELVAVNMLQKLNQEG